MRQTAVSREGDPRGRAGQTLVIAISVMFLLFFIGALFVAMIARNLNRVQYAGDTSSAAALAESGLNWVNTQLTFSEEGADWRPAPTWPAPLSPAAEAVRKRDPDYFWLSDNGTYVRPYTRIASGDGRFLIRVDYDPAYRSTQQNETRIFDPLSGYLRIHSVGRPGRIDPNDPTQVASPGNPAFQPGQILGQHQELEGWKPLGLTDQLWWITNKNKQRGPAPVGLQAMQDGQGHNVLYEQLFKGGFRSNMDVLFQGPTTFDLFPNSGEGVYVAGSVQMGTVPNAGSPIMAPVTVNVLNDASGNPVTSLMEGPSDTSGFQFNYRGAPDTHGVFLDDNWFSDNSVDSQRSVRFLDPPSIGLTESGSSGNRYQRMTEGTGINLTLNQGGVKRVVNTGDYGYGGGIYVDNFEDIQYPDNRDSVVNEWLRRGPPDVSQTGWSGTYYTPSVRTSGTVHPVLLVELLPQGIRLTRYDRDIKGRNLEPENQYKSRIFYQAFSKSNPNRAPLNPTDLDEGKGLSPAGPTVLMPYPANGVLYAEGSLRIKGNIGQTTSQGAAPVDLTVVSGGTIYVEGNLLKSSPASHLALLAHDYVCLNPTQFTSVRPYEDVTLQPDGPSATSFHYEVPQSKDLDLVFSSAAPITARGMLLNLQQTAGFSDNSSTTSVSMYVNGIDSGHQYDFSSNAVRPPFAPSGAGLGGGGTPYLFRFFQMPADPNWWMNSWGVTNYQSSTASTVNYERKSFWIPRAMLNTAAGAENLFRFHVNPTPDGQPWWLAGASLIPWQDQPLQIEVDAVMYAENGSWFVVPQPWFNNDPLDSRQIFMRGDGQQRTAGSRAPGTFPANTDDYPFYREPLNVRVTVDGSITEGAPAPSTDQSQWVQKMTMNFKDPQSGRAVRDLLSLPNSFNPGIDYQYDADLRDWVRWRSVVRGDEGIAYTGTATAVPNGAQTLDAVRKSELARQDNIVTMPILPRLPTSGTLFRGRPL